MGEKGPVVSKQQLTDEFLDGFRVCEVTPKVEETAVCSETDVDASSRSSFASRSMVLTKIENNVEKIENDVEKIENNVEKIENNVEKIKNDVEKIENNVEKIETKGQAATLLDAVGDGKRWEAAPRRSIVLRLTLLTFMELTEDGE